MKKSNVKSINWSLWSLSNSMDSFAQPPLLIEFCYKQWNAIRYAIDIILLFIGQSTSIILKMIFQISVFKYNLIKLFMALIISIIFTLILLI